MLRVFSILILVASGVIGGPLRHEDGHTLAQISQISELGEHVARSKVIPGLVKSIAMDDREAAQSKFTIPGPIPIDTEQIKKVAQILALLGEQVIPAILGNGYMADSIKDADIPNDDVNA